MKELSTMNTFAFKPTDTLLERTAKISKISGVAQVVLDVCLALVKQKEEYRQLGYASFADYYTQELGRLKSEISKSLTRGEFLVRLGFHEETAPEVKPTNLYTAITCLPDKSPEYILSTAQTNTIAEILENRRDEAFPDHETHDWESAHHCKTCGKYQLHV